MISAIDPHLIMVILWRSSGYLQACETPHEYTLTESQRVNLRDGFHSGIRGILMKK